MSRWIKSLRTKLQGGYQLAQHSRDLTKLWCQKLQEGDQLRYRMEDSILRNGMVITEKYLYCKTYPSMNMGEKWRRAHQGGSD